ncbi:MAG: hypothetical protein CMN84_11925 [Spongiibacteraceae bacterium]|nr:hypothetical protein [Spongiibacteraceae bacterium]
MQKSLPYSTKGCGCQGPGSNTGFRPGATHSYSHRRNTVKTFVIAASIALLTSLPGYAEEADSTQALLKGQQATPTAQLLELQRSGKIASRNEQQLPGKAQSKIYERYINSFGHPIPETYINESFSE